VLTCSFARALDCACVVDAVFGAIATTTSTTSAAAVDDAALKALNTRCMEIKRYHSVVDTMSLAYACRYLFIHLMP
jgi:hypothetical protein